MNDFMKNLKEIRDSIKELQKTGYGLLIALFTFVGVFLSQSDLKGETMAGAAFKPEKMKDADKTEQLDEEEGETVEEEAVSGAEEEAAEQSERFQDPEKMPIRAVDQIETETLWLARCIYSESKQPREQELIAWVIRNRVETNYRGNRTYRETVLDPYQFSAFNPGNPKRNRFTNLDVHSDAEGWQRALSIADRVRDADASQRPFARDTRHFYSERSMAGGRQPNWAHGERPVKPDRPYEIDVERFRFYSDVS